jgi:CO/xanthine dehydrogenase FAD-binding subunit
VHVRRSVAIRHEGQICAAKDADVKPAAFDYVVAESVDHALDVLAAAGGDAKILAGGQSLMPMINFRLAKPAILVDINRIAGLDTVDEADDRLTLGALVRHRMTVSDPVIAARLPMLAHAMTHVAHFTVRNRGTFVGSVCHADPAAEMPMMAVLLDAEIQAVSKRGTRSLSARDFFVGSLMTALEPDELVTAIGLPFVAADAGWGFEEFARRHGDYALAAVAATVVRHDGRARDVRIAVMGVDETPIRVPAVEDVLEGSDFGRPALARAVDALRSAITPNSDLHASAGYRRHLAGVLMCRSLTAAWSRARETVQ